VAVDIDPTLATLNLWVMLQHDDHTADVFEFGSVEDADMPVTVSDSLSASAVQIAPIMAWCKAKPRQPHQLGQVMIDQLAL